LTGWRGEGMISGLVGLIAWDLVIFPEVETIYLIAGAVGCRRPRDCTDGRIGRGRGI
jgi:hypothetical protein